MSNVSNAIISMNSRISNTLTTSLQRVLHFNIFNVTSNLFLSISGHCSLFIHTENIRKPRGNKERTFPY